MSNNVGSTANGSHFEWGCDGNVIWVKDLDKGGVSVTNNIDRVLGYINEHLPVREYLVMYRDSMGIWDRISIEKGHSLNSSFMPLNEKEYENAITKLRMQANL